MGEVTREEFDALVSKVGKLEVENSDTRVWQATYGERIDTIYKLVEKLSSKPEKRWETVVSGLFTLAIAAIMFLVGKYFS
jgi:hypothetical protein